MKACPRSPVFTTSCRATFFSGNVVFFLENPFRKSHHIVMSLIAILVDFQTAAHTGAPGRLRSESCVFTM